MPKVGEAVLAGKSGKEYSMNVYTSDIQFNDFIPGVYLISAVENGEEKFLFLGETDNIFPLLRAHPEQEKLEAASYNRVSFYKNASKEVRTGIVEDLLPVLNPALNA